MLVQRYLLLPFYVKRWPSFLPKIVGWGHRLTLSLSLSLSLSLIELTLDICVTKIQVLFSRKGLLYEFFGGIRVTCPLDFVCCVNFFFDLCRVPNVTVSEFSFMVAPSIYSIVNLQCLWIPNYALELVFYLHIEHTHLHYVHFTNRRG